MKEDEDGYAVDAGPLYDGAYEKLRDPSGDRDFYRSLAVSTGGPVLELGCGSGRVLLPIAREGIPCVGLDSSPAMLEAFRRKGPPENLRLVTGAVEDFDLSPQRFAFIYAAFRVLQHVVAVEDQLACLRTVRRHLAPGGLFAFDVFAPRLERVALTDEPEAEDVRFPLDGDEIVRFASVRRELSTQTMKVRFRYERRRNGEVIDSREARADMRWFFRYELEHLLARSGFSRFELFGGFDRRPYDYVSGETVVIARPDD